VEAEAIAVGIFNADFESRGVADHARTEIQANIAEQLRVCGETAVRAWVTRGINRSKDANDPAAWLASTFKTAKCPPVESGKPSKKIAAHQPFVPPAEAIGSGEIDGKIQTYLQDYRDLGPVAYAEKYGLAGRHAGQGRDARTGERSSAIARVLRDMPSNPTTAAPGT